ARSPTVRLHLAEGVQEIPPFDHLSVEAVPLALLHRLSFLRQPSRRPVVSAFRHSTHPRSRARLLTNLAVGVRLLPRGSRPADLRPLGHRWLFPRLASRRIQAPVGRSVSVIGLGFA